MYDALPILLRSARLVWTTSSIHSLLLFGTTLTQGVVPVARLWVAKLIIDELVAGISTPGLRPAVIDVGMWQSSLSSWRSRAALRLLAKWYKQ